MRAGAKKYNTSYKKKVDVFRDTFLPRRSPKEIIQCRGCGAFYHRRRWTLIVPTEFSPPALRRAWFCPESATPAGWAPGSAPERRHGSLLPPVGARPWLPSALRPA